MNSVHDMGGMHGMGPIEYEKDEPVFHERWEARIFALNRAIRAWRKWNIDASRYAVESIPGAEYLRMSYYELRIPALIDLMIRTGMVTRDEVESGTPAPGAAKATPALRAEMVAGALATGTPKDRPAEGPARFAVGDAVRARNIHPVGHTRLPRYARGKMGTIHRVHGVHVFPDTNAAFLGEKPQYLYSVRFAARELWGDEAGERDAVFADLWDDYLEHV